MRRNRTILFAVPAALASLALFGGCQGGTSESPGEVVGSEGVGQAQEALSTCLTIRRGTFGTVEDQSIIPNSNYPQWSIGTLHVGPASESLLRFDVSSIPVGSTITSATMTLTTTSTYSGEILNARLAAVPWTESTVTFAGFNQQYGKFAGSMTPSAPNTQFTMSVDVRRVQGWLDGTIPNYGLLLETMVDWPRNYNETQFVSSESTNPALRPSLQVCYTTKDWCAPQPCQNGGTCQSGLTGYTCTCPPGFTGADCQTNIDECAGNPCLNGAACVDGVNSFTCQCAPGYTGTHCETDINECAPQPCQNGGVCTDQVNGYTCHCPAGFTGADCQTNIDDCTGSPCQNGGACVDGIAGYTCQCAPGFTGSNCQIDIDDCAGNGCQNGSTCVDGIAAYTCACAPGFTGQLCEINIDDCAGNPCQNGGACVDGVSSYACACAPGYTGANCQIDVDDCAGSPCLNGGSCVDGVNAYACQCPAGFTGTNCQTLSDNCAGNPCQNGGSCNNGASGYTCSCTPGYTGTNCQACSAGLTDCDGDAANGCEVNLSSSAANCGACGNACGAGLICTQGACQTPPGGQTTLPPFSAPEPHGALAPVVGDIDGDGHLDVLVANAESGSATAPSGSLSVFRGVGDGTLQTEQYYTGAPLSSNAVVLADVDGDGWLDAITVNGQTNLGSTAGSISVYLNAGASAPGTFGAPTSFTTGAPGSIHLCAADFDGDGHVDIATTSVSTNQVSVLFGNGAGGFGAPQLISIVATGGVQSTIGAVDLNGDGRPDLVVTSPSSARLSVLLNLGGGSFAAPVAYANSQSGQTAGLSFGDADGDGKVDVISNGAAGRFLFFFKGQGNGTLATGAASTVSGSAVANSALGVVTGDFNGDGKLDAYVLHTASSGGVYPMTGNGAGAFSVGTHISTGSSPGLNAIATADMNHDGYLDLILTNRGSATVTVILNAL